MMNLVQALLLFALFAAVLLSTETFVEMAHVYVEDCRQWWRQRGGLLGPGPWSN